MLSRGENVEVNALVERGWNISAIARHLGRDRGTISNYVNGRREPPWYPRRLLTLETRMEHGSIRGVPKPASVGALRARHPSLVAAREAGGAETPEGNDP